MNITLAVDDEVIRKAREKADRLGTSVDQLVRVYLENFIGRSEPELVAEEFRRLSELSRGHSESSEVQSRGSS